MEKTLNFVASFQAQQQFQQECRMLQVATTDMQRDMCWATVCLENTQLSSAFTMLKEDLSEAVRQDNRDGVKVELKYQHGSGSQVNLELVGYTTEVSRLKNIVLEYKRNHENYHDYLALPRPEMADHFSEIFTLVCMKKSSVEMKPRSSPSPCVHLTGPRCKVESLFTALCHAFRVLSRNVLK